MADLNVPQQIQISNGTKTACKLNGSILVNPGADVPFSGAISTIDWLEPGMIMSGNVSKTADADIKMTEVSTDPPMLNVKWGSTPDQQADFVSSKTKPEDEPVSAEAE